MKICVVTTNRADYGRLKPVMEVARRDPRLELQVVVGTPLFFDHLFWYLRHGEPISFWKSLPWHIKARWKTIFSFGQNSLNFEHLTRLLSQDGFPIHARLPSLLEGGNLRVMTKMSGLCLLGLPEIFEKLKPDLVLINGDRFEMLPIAFATVSSNIFLAHIEGGDVSGTLDESTRHAITKLAHFHFPATPKSGDRIIAMGEDEERVFATGSPVIDTVSSLDLSLDNSIYDRNNFGLTKKLDFTKPFALILQHPVTTRYEENRSDMEELISALEQVSIQKLFLASNIDAGSDGVSVALRDYRKRKPPQTAFLKNLDPEDYYKILANTAVAVGNSSSFIREGAFLGMPAVIVGDRQKNRERGLNAVETPFSKEKILAAVHKQIAHGKYQRSYLFGDGQAANKIVNTLACLNLQKNTLQKNFKDRSNE